MVIPVVFAEIVQQQKRKEMIKRPFLDHNLVKSVLNTFDAELLSHKFFFKIFSTTHVDV